MVTVCNQRRIEPFWRKICTNNTDILVKKVRSGSGTIIPDPEPTWAKKVPQHWKKGGSLLELQSKGITDFWFYQCYVRQGEDTSLQMFLCGHITRLSVVLISFHCQTQLAFNNPWAAQQSDSLIAVCLLQLYRKDTFISGSRCRRRRLRLAAIEGRGGNDKCRTGQERRPGPEVAQDQPGHAARHKDGDGGGETL
jgi:hypothetical protein